MGGTEVPSEDRDGLRETQRDRVQPKSHLTQSATPATFLPKQVPPRLVMQAMPLVWSPTESRQCKLGKGQLLDTRPKNSGDNMVSFGEKPEQVHPSPSLFNTVLKQGDSDRDTYFDTHTHTHHPSAGARVSLATNLNVHSGHLDTPSTQNHSFNPCPSSAA